MRIGAHLVDREVRLREFSLPLRSPLGTAKGEMTERRGLLVELRGELETGDEVRGVGEATPLPPWTEGYEECLATWVTLRDAANGTVSDGDENEVDIDGVPPAARHAMNLVGADASARYAKRPLAAWLADRTGDSGGSDAAAEVPVNATVGDGSVESTVEEAESAVVDGFDCLKLKAGARDLDADLDRCRAVREAVGDDVALRADANGAWSRDEAERAVDALAALDFEYVEQPLPADDHEGLAALRGRGVGIALDESVNGPNTWPDPVREFADVVVLKPMAQGGPTRTVSVARRLRAQGVTPVVTTTVDAVVARTAAVHAAAAIPNVPACGLATGDLLAEDLAADPVPVEDGRVRVPEGPGLAGDAFDRLVGDDSAGGGSAGGGSVGND
ncbi:mandelate racemase/muconate lactonizing enzyme family protein [Halobium salinum]|uniref:o-succinylbenzoate synthase n=1 Tax=Halobium salinum TaxID=1364940 RepID=A0ABD5PDD2_9EURY|nr:enolase C-terminal domain-like protein [Halobium salinum]